MQCAGGEGVKLPGKSLEGPSRGHKRHPFPLGVAALAFPTSFSWLFSSVLILKATALLGTGRAHQTWAPQAALPGPTCSSKEDSLCSTQPDCFRRPVSSRSTMVSTLEEDTAEPSWPALRPGR